jgi:hypothetical protein
MVDALLVFSPLQEISFFVLRSPYFDQIGVAPLLRRRLFGLQRLFSLLVFFVPKYVSSLRLLLSLVALSTFRQPSQLAGLPLYSSLSTQAPILAKLPTQRRSVPTFELFVFTLFNS